MLSETQIQEYYTGHPLGVPALGNLGHKHFQAELPRAGFVKLIVLLHGYPESFESSLNTGPAVAVSVQSFDGTMISWARNRVAAA